MAEPAPASFPAGKRFRENDSSEPDFPAGKRFALGGRSAINFPAGKRLETVCIHKTVATNLRRLAVFRGEAQLLV